MMRKILKLCSFFGLILTVLPPIFFFLGKISLDSSHLLMVFGMVIWFLTAPFWINSKVDKAP
jgi:hypothetical protein